MARAELELGEMRECWQEEVPSVHDPSILLNLLCRRRLCGIRQMFSQVRVESCLALAG